MRLTYSRSSPASYRRPPPRDCHGDGIARRSARSKGRDAMSAALLTTVRRRTGAILPAILLGTILAGYGFAGTHRGGVDRTESPPSDRGPQAGVAAPIGNQPCRDCTDTPLPPRETDTPVPRATDTPVPPRATT